MPDKTLHDKTRAVHAGRDPRRFDGAINTPVYHVSTILSPTLAQLRANRFVKPGDAITYGVHGSPTSFGLEDAIRALEGGYRTRLQPSGLAAVSASLLAFLSPGDHLLMTDSAYGPTRSFCNGMLTRLGVSVEYYDPLIGGDIARLMRPQTKVVFVESPGSWTFEVQDIPAIAAVAREHGAITIMDNTWASPLYFKPFAHGVDVSVQAVTKYIAGHSDLVLGAVTCSEAAYPAFRAAQAQLGLSAGPDDVAMAARGMRTMPTRLRQHWKSGLRVADWLQSRPEVAEVIHPALPDDAGYRLWSRDFLGASSLFAFVLKPQWSDESRLAAMLDHMVLHGMGYSWGGFESLLIPVEPSHIRTATRWPRDGRAEGQVMRIHVGLESVDDLIDDLAAGFERLTR